MKDRISTFVLFGIIAVLILTTTIYARNAESEAKKVQTQLTNLSITAQNRCIIKVILTYPAPVSQAQFNVVLADYDSCIKAELATASK